MALRTCHLFETVAFHSHFQAIDFLKTILVFAVSSLLISFLSRGRVEGRKPQEKNQALDRHSKLSAAGSEK